jgi:hypothetical protein
VTLNNEEDDEVFHYENPDAPSKKKRNDIDFDEDDEEEESVKDKKHKSI